MSARPADQVVTQSPEVEAWMTRQLAKPGGHGPLPKAAQAVLASVFGQPPAKAASA